MRKARLAVVGMLIAFLGACSGGRPSQSEREFAFLQFVKENSNDEARIEDFKSNQCQKAEGAPSYTCDASRPWVKTSAIKWTGSTPSPRWAALGRSLPASNSHR